MNSERIKIYCFRLYASLFEINNEGRKVLDKMDLASLLLISFPETILTIALGFLLVGIRPRCRDLLMIGFLQIPVAYVARALQLPFGIHTIIQIIFFTVNVFFVTRLPYRIVLFTSLLGLIIILALESVVKPFMYSITGYTTSYVYAHTLIRFYFFLPKALIMLILIGICKFFKFSLINYPVSYRIGHLPIKIFKNNLKEYITNPKNLFFYIIVLLALILIIILISGYIVYSFNFPQRHINILAGLFGVLIIILTVLFFTTIEKAEQYAIKNYEAKRTAENLILIEQLIDSSRKQRHDFQHQLHAIYGLMESGSHEEAGEYINRLFGTITKTRELIKTDNLNVSAILFAKIGLAEARDIDLEVSVECSLKELPLRPHEVSSLLGNLIDNVLDAVDNNVGEHRRVKVMVDLERGVYVITVANAGKPVGLDILESILKPGFTSKEGHSGLGMSIVKDIAAKYGGSIDMISNCEEMTFIIKIPLKRQGNLNGSELSSSKNCNLPDQGVGAGFR